MGLLAQLREIEIRITERLREAVSSLVQLTYFTRTTATGDDATQGYDTYSDEPSYDYPVRRFQHFGFRSVPPVQCACVRVLSSSGAVNGATVAEDSAKYGPTDLLEGEASLYNSVTGTTVKLDKDGNVSVSAALAVNITAASGSNVNLNVSGAGNVLLAGGGAGVSRIGDAIVVDTSNIGGSLELSLDGRYTVSNVNSHIGNFTGHITAGSSKVKSG